MEMRTESSWQILYREALLEEDPTKTPFLIDEAYKAIQRRMQELWCAGEPVTKERRELDSALYFLNLLTMLGSMEVKEFEYGDAWWLTYDS